MMINNWKLPTIFRLNDVITLVSHFMLIIISLISVLTEHIQFTRNNCLSMTLNCSRLKICHFAIIMMAVFIFKCIFMRFFTTLNRFTSNLDTILRESYFLYTCVRVCVCFWEKC